ncbi:hypothetical protein XENTR_v10017635 [Xenopus tropicalis]|nr:hypothetical protein XENTR_v10017635 [Xenopus tropicalis]
MAARSDGHLGNKDSAPHRQIPYFLSGIWPDKGESESTVALTHTNPRILNSDIIDLKTYLVLPSLPKITHNAV